MIEIHAEARVSPFVDIEDSIRGTRIVIAAKAMIDSFVKIKPVGGAGDFYLGERSTINSGCVLYTGNGITIGNDVAIAANCTFAPVNHAFKDKNKRINQQGFLQSKGGIIVEDDVWIGANCIILDGSILRQGCVIGAGSLVRAEVPAFSINVGNPLRLTGWRE
jgi:acetyltransferase-like isoleucine patch superfamily enzyme